MHIVNSKLLSDVRIYAAWFSNSIHLTQDRFRQNPIKSLFTKTSRAVSPLHIWPGQHSLHQRAIITKFKNNKISDVPSRLANPYVQNQSASFNFLSKSRSYKSKISHSNLSSLRAHRSRAKKQSNSRVSPADCTRRAKKKRGEKSHPSLDSLSLPPVANLSGALY